MSVPQPRVYARVAIVTGGAQGIGEAIARRLGRDGFTVVIADLESKSSVVDALVEELKSQYHGREFTKSICDVSKEEDVKTLVAKVVEKFGRLDCMVANAGIATLGALSEITLADWNLIHSVNANGTLFCYREAAEAMIRCGTARGGRIIGASSILGKHSAKGFGAYSSTKFTVRSLTQTAAFEYGEHGITVNAYAPGYIQSAMVDATLTATTKKFGLAGKDFGETVVGKSALGRLGKPEEVAALVSFFASGDSSFISGQIISVDGGFRMD